MADFSSLNVTDHSLPYAGWVSSSRDRGSIDVLWSCCFTIFLCIWVATHPNAVAQSEGTYHRFQDKFRLAMIALLGPDFLFGIAAGQFSSAWRSVQVGFQCRTNPIYLHKADSCRHSKGTVISATASNGHWPMDSSLTWGASISRALISKWAFPSQLRNCTISFCMIT